jgi:hypothetical protein
VFEPGLERFDWVDVDYVGDDDGDVPDARADLWPLIWKTVASPSNRLGRPTGDAAGIMVRDFQRAQSKSPVLDFLTSRSGTKPV